MNKTNPKLLIALFVVIALATYIKLSNPHKKFSTKQYWQSASVNSVRDVPDAALEPGNKNGPVLMWAATTVSDPEIIKALVQRGADINESDIIFSGTPLSGAASDNNNPEIIDTLVELGADVSQEIAFGRTALMNAAVFNTNPDTVSYTHLTLPTKA